MQSFRLPGAVSLSFRSLDSPFHGVPPAWNRSLSSRQLPRLPNSLSRFSQIYTPQQGGMTALQRSLSLSSTTSAKSEERAEASDLLTELRSLPAASTASAHPEPAPVGPAPSWMQELMQSSSPRPSRASSIVSTRTRFSTMTLDDPRADCRSIDIHVGGQYFRISRDGSKITQDLPPPYTDPPPPDAIRMSDSSSIDMFPREPRTEADYDEDDGNLTEVQDSPVRMQATALSADEVDMSSPVGGSATRETPERNPLGQVASPLRRRNGVRLPSLVTEPFDGHMGDFVSRGRERQVRRASTLSLAARSAGPILMNTSDRAILPDSPTFIGRDASAVFPRIAESVPGLGMDDETSALAMDSENDISLHYARLMRQLDREHRKALHERDKELEQLRVRLNEVDTVYRQELRARDFMIDDLKTRLDHLQETQEQRVEKARHEVEDLWESRWKQRDFHLRERMRRLEELQTAA